MKIRFRFFIVLFFVSKIISAENYYVSKEGNDSNTGTSPQAAFKTIYRVTQINLSQGDRVLFKCGQTFYGQLIIQNSGTVENPIYIGSYGKGEKPELTGTKHISEFEEIESTHFVAHTDIPVKKLFLNDNLLQLARFPDDDYLRIDKNDSTYLYDSELKKVNAELKGTTLRALTCNWQWENRIIYEKQDNKLLLDSAVWRPFRKGFGYYLDNNPKFLSENGEWYYNSNEKKLHLILDSNPKDKILKATLLEHGIYIKNRVANVVIEGLMINGFNNSGIFCEANVCGISILNNKMVNTEIYGVNLEKNAKECRIENNSIINIRGIGLALLEPNNCIIKNNTIKKIGLIPGYGYNGVNNGTGIALINNEFREVSDKNVARSNTISYNRIDSTGYNGIRIDGCQNIVEYNVIKNSVLTMNDGGGIYCWSVSDNLDYTSGNVIRNNIVSDVHGNTTASAGEHNLTCCFYIDNYSNDITLENNVAMNCQKGFVLNDASFDIKLKGNLTYNVKKGLVIDVYLKDSTIHRGHFSITNNTFFLKKAENIAIELSFQKKHKLNAGVLDSNLYVSPLYHIFNSIFEREMGIEQTTHYGLKEWQLVTGFDKNSNAIDPGPDGRWWELKDKSQILVNETREPVHYSFPEKNIRDMRGIPVSEMYVPPFSAKVIQREP